MHTRFLYLFLFLALLSTTSITAQINFESGYIITNDGTKRDCLIKNEDWRYNPNSIEYKLSPDQNSNTGDLNNIIEFGIPGQYRFIKASVKIDRSSEVLNQLSTQKQATYNNETHFLRILTEGEYTLMEYRDESLIRFFYQSNNGIITALEYKKYLNEEGQLAYNNRYQQQLYNLLQCEGIPASAFSSLKYNRKDLNNILTKYHECLGATYTRLEKNRKTGTFRLTAIIGINHNSVEVVKGIQTSNSVTKLDPTFNPRLGMELEYIFPFNKNKWSLIVQPALNTYKSEKLKSESQNLYYDLYVDVTYLETIIGLKHIMFLNTYNQIYILAGTNIDTYLNSDLYYFTGEGTSPYPHLDNGDFSLGMAFNIGIGYSFKKFRLDLMSGLGKKIRGSSFRMSDYDLNFEAKKTMFSLNLGYRIL